MLNLEKNQYQTIQKELVIFHILNEKMFEVRNVTEYL